MSFDHPEDEYQRTSEEMQEADVRRLARIEIVEEVIRRAREEIVECDAQNTSLHTARQAFERQASYWERRLEVMKAGSRDPTNEGG